MLDCDRLVGEQRNRKYKRLCQLDGPECRRASDAKGASGVELAGSIPRGQIEAAQTCAVGCAVARRCDAGEFTPCDKGCL
jgi:hypothetical protein